MTDLRKHVDYTSRDYEALRADMIRTIQARIPQWDASESDFGTALVEAYAYALDTVHYYLDRVANESYLTTAVQRESLFSIAEMFNYTPKEAQPAGVWLQFANITQADVEIPAGTRCQATVVTDSGAANIKNFETLESKTVPAIVGAEPGVTTVYANEGRTYTDDILGVSTGFVRQRYILPRTHVLNRTITVTVQLGDSITEWSQVNSLEDQGPTDRSFTVTRLTDGSSRLEFGDGFNGQIPALHGTIRATYRVGGGSQGNVAIGGVNVIVDPVLYGISVTNPAPAVGGVDTESIDSIRTNAARAFRSRNRAVTISDFETLAEAMNDVAKARAVGYSASSVTTFIVPVPDGTREDPQNDGITYPSPPTQYLLDRTQDMLETYSMAGVSVQVFGPSWQHVFVRLFVKCQETAIQKDVEADIRSRLLDLYAFERVDFGGVVNAGHISAALVDVDGVEYIEVEAISQDSEIFNPATDPETFSIKTIDMDDIAVSAILDFQDEHIKVTLEGGVQES